MGTIFGGILNDFSTLVNKDSMDCDSRVNLAFFLGEVQQGNSSKKSVSKVLLVCCTLKEEALLVMYMCVEEQVEEMEQSEEVGIK